MTEIDPTVAPAVPLDGAGLAAVEGVDETGRDGGTDVRSGGDPAGAPLRDDDRRAAEEELLGAGPTTEDEVAHGDSGQDDGYLS
jgi:hypothetical protein